jgi:hypothetical protein
VNSAFTKIGKAEVKRVNFDVVAVFGSSLLYAASKILARILSPFACASLSCSQTWDLWSTSLGSGGIDVVSIASFKTSAGNTKK